MVENICKNDAHGGDLPQTSLININTESLLKILPGQIEGSNLDKRTLEKVIQLDVPNTSIFDYLKTSKDQCEQIVKYALDIYKRYPFTTSMVVFGAVSIVKPATGLPMIVKSVVDAVRDKLLYAEIDENESRSVIEQIEDSAQQHKVLTEISSTAVTTGIQTVVLDILGVTKEQTIGNAWNNGFNATLDILTNNVDAIKNLAFQHPVIAQCLTTGLTIASNIAIGKYIQSMPVALVKCGLSLCIGFFSSKFGTSIFSEAKKWLGYEQPDIPSEHVIHQNNV